MGSKGNLLNFQITKEVGGWLKIDENQRKWFIPDGFAGGIKNPRVYSFDDILGYELLEDGDSITKGGLGRAVAGGLLFGGVGAIVGGVTGKRKTNNTCTSLRVKITLNDMANPNAYINMITVPTKKTGFLYKTCQTQAQEIMSILQVICESKRIDVDKTTMNDREETFNVADEIMKFKQLLDAGAITEEEFTEQKRRLLGN